MKFHVVTLKRAETDIRTIASWLAERSPQGAFSWLDAYGEMISFLAEHADFCATAQENDDCTIALKESLFATRRGQPYRVIFTIVGSEVRILRVRGPGQPPLFDDELV